MISVVCQQGYPEANRCRCNPCIGGDSIFGKVIEGMDVVYHIARGDKIERLKSWSRSNQIVGDFVLGCGTVARGSLHMLALASAKLLLQLILPTTHVPRLSY